MEDASKKPNPAEPQFTPSLPAIVGIAVGAAAVILMTVGWLCLRRRRRRALRSAEELPKGIRKRNRASSLSFRCQTHLTPKTPNFPQDLEAGAQDDTRVSVFSRLSLWQTREPSPVEPTASPVPEKTGAKPQQKDASLLISTNLPPRGSPKPHSPRSWMSPTDEYKTPSSTTSMRSTTALLPPIAAYDPAMYSPPTRSQPNPHWEPQRPSYASPTSSTRTASPSRSQGAWPLSTDQRTTSSPRVRPSLWERPPRGDSLVPYAHVDTSRHYDIPVPRQSFSQNRPRQADLGGGSPTESMTLKVTFPPPPRAAKGKR